MTASGTRSILPPLSPEEARHSAAVAALIHAELAAAAGWLSFERFMELALYAPGLGYYSAGSFKIGAGGDLVTAPEVSDLFGRCLARQCADPLACHEQYAAADASLAQACRELRAALPAPLPEGYTSEVCLRVAPWIAALSECLGRGVLLLCDYGLPRSHYYHPQRGSGT